MCYIITMKSTQFLRSTKLVATLGPSSNTENKISKLISSGTNVFRLNFSHGLHEDHLKTIKIIRKLEKKTKFQIGILADLQGPKFRIGEVEKNVKLKVNDIFILDKDKQEGTKKRVYLGHSEIFSSIKINSIMLIDDGKIKLKVLSKRNDFIKTKLLGSANNL